MLPKDFPKDARYTQTHQWVRLENDIATIGITKYAADQLSDLTYVELPDVGEDLGADSVLGTIESVKAAADLICPIDGKIVEVNDAVVKNPEAISEDPYDDGWLVKLKPSDLSQVNELMTSEQYQEFVLAEAGEEEEDEEEEEEEIEDVDVVKLKVADKVLPPDVADLDEDEEKDEGLDKGVGDEEKEEEEEEEEELL